MKKLFATVLLFTAATATAIAGDHSGVRLYDTGTFEITHGREQNGVDHVIGVVGDNASFTFTYPDGMTAPTISFGTDYVDVVLPSTHHLPSPDPPPTYEDEILYCTNGEDIVGPWANCICTEYVDALCTPISGPVLSGAPTSGLLELNKP